LGEPVLRRHFVQLLVSGILFVALGNGARRARAASPYSFRHGVASGDPLANGVIIWTRVSGAKGERVRVIWQVAADSAMTDLLRAGEQYAVPDHDYTVKVDVRDLPSGKQLFYRFIVDGVESALGRTRTLPTGSPESARFAVATCSNYPAGYFHAYREIANRDDFDAVIHLGDYIYEYGSGGYATERAEELGRVPEPAGEIVTREDYWRRHAQYKTDADLQAMHAQHPMIAVWDDHEVCNDSWRTGAENHNDGEGRWSRRRNAAIQAYFDWMPIRGSARGRRTQIFRDFRYGDLLSLIMLDTRLYGRDRQPEITPEMSKEMVNSVMLDRKRRMLGKKQERWLRESLQRAQGTTWQVIGQQVMVSPVRVPDLAPFVDLDGPSSAPRDVLEYTVAMSKYNPPMELDTWDGYAAAREDLYADLAEFAENPVMLSGDLHTSIAANLLPANSERPVAVEFMPPSVSSPGIADYVPEHNPGAAQKATLDLNPHLRYLETTRRGWLCLSLTRTECTGEWHLLDSVHDREYTSAIDRRLSVASGKVANGLYDS
jgi:alkaline phosphatase D